MKNVIYIGPFRFPEGDAAAARVLNNGKLLRSLGYNVTFVSWGKGQNISNNRQKNNLNTHDGFQYIHTEDIDVKQKHIWAGIHNYLFYGRKSLKVLNSFSKNIDYIIAYNPTLYFSLKLILFSKKNGIKLISDLTEWYSSYELPGGKYAPPFWLNEINMRIIQRYFIRKKIVISTYLDKEFSQSNNLILPPLVDILENKWKVHVNVLPKFFGKRIIYAGNPENKDQLEHIISSLITCLKSGLNIQLILLGVSKNYFLNSSFKNEIILYPNNIQLLEYVPQTQVPNYYKDSDFSIIVRQPNKKNMAGFPTKFVESMMSGCPVICNDISDITKYLKNGINGFLLPTWSIIKIVDLFMNISNMDEQHLKQMKKSAFKCAVENFNYLVYKEQTSCFLK